jgi:hypothetical protein
MLDTDKHSELADELVNIIAKTDCNSHEILDAVVAIAAWTCVKCADNDGRGLRRLVDQFVKTLFDQICSEYDHSPPFHDPAPDYDA